MIPPENENEQEYRAMLRNYPDAELLNLVYRFELDPSLLSAASAELRERDLLPEDLELRRQAVIERESARLEAGKKATAAQQFFGWIGILGILGLIIGHHLYFSKTKNIYNGQEFSRYDDESRESGRYMFYISVATHSLFILYKVLPLFS